MAANSDRNPKALAEKGEEFLRNGDRRGAGAWFSAALRSIAQGMEAPPGLASKLQSFLHKLQQDQLQHLVSHLEDNGHVRSDWHPRFAKALAMMMGEMPRPPESHRYPQMPSMFYYPDLPYVQFAETVDWGWVEAVERATDSILIEAQQLLEAEGHFGPYVRTQSDRPQHDAHGMLENDDWSTLELYEAGKPVTDLTTLVPETHEILTQNAPLCDISKRAPNIMFSLLKAGKSIPPHTGMINARFICHLPLIIPGEGWLRVGSERRSWNIGQMIAFDDSVEHDATNRSYADRLVLIFDVWRPELEEIEREQLKSVFEAVDSY